MASPSDDTKLQILHDHYKDTCERITDYIRSRERYFLVIIVICTVMLFQIYSPENFSKVLMEFLAKQVGLTDGIDFTFIGSILWFALLGALIKYCQRMVLLERQYSYLHRLEKEISSSYFDDKTYQREGVEYLKDYPKFSSWASFIYAILFPCILLVVVAGKIWIEITRAGIPVLTVFNVLMFVAIVYSLIIYLPGIHRRHECKECDCSKNTSSDCESNGAQRE